MKKTRFLSTILLVFMLVGINSALLTVTAAEQDYDVPITEASYIDVTTKDTNNNSDPMYTRDDGGGNNRFIYIKIDCRDYVGITASNVVLKLFSPINDQPNQPTSGEVYVYPVEDKNWTETGITWNNPPADRDTHGEKIATITYTGNNTFYSVDLTDYFNGLEDKIVALKLVGSKTAVPRYNTAAAADAGRYKFSSDECTTVENRPTLTVTCDKSSVSDLVSSVDITSETLDLYTNWNSAKLISEVFPSGAANKVLNWQSSNSAVATVAQDGTVTPVSAGTATITAASTDGSNISDTCLVTVTAGTVELIEITEDTYVDYTNQAVNYSTADHLYTRNQPNYYRISYIKANAASLLDKNVIAAELRLNYMLTSNGTLAGVSNRNGGIIGVTGLSDTSFDVTEMLYTSQPSTASSVACGAMVLDTEANDAFGKYFSSDITNYFKGSADGKLAFKIDGATKSPDGNNLTGNFVYQFRSSETAVPDSAPYIKVLYKANEVDVTGIALNESNLLLAASDEPVSLTATITPQDADDKRVEYISSNPAVATVSAYGVVTPVAIGTTVITARARGAATLTTATCTVTVAKGNVISIHNIDEDTYVNAQNGTTAMGNTYDYLAVREYRPSNQGATQVRTAYLKADLGTDLTSPVKKATLNLYCYNPGSPTNPYTAGGVLPVYAIATPKAAWSETAITWSNSYFKQQGVLAKHIGNLVISENPFDKWFSVDITEAVNDFFALSQTHDLSFVIEGDKKADVSGNSTTDSQFYFKARKTAQTTNMPYIRLETETPDPNCAITTTYKNALEQISPVWVEGGSTNVKVDIQNSVLGSASSFDAIYGIYAKDGKLVDVKYVTVEKSGTAVTTVNLEIDNLPEWKGYSTKILFWNNENIMTPVYTIE